MMQINYAYDELQNHSDEVEIFDLKLNYLGLN